MEKYGSQGLITIQLLGENHRHNPPGTVDLLEWAQTFEHTTPVLADPEWVYTRHLWSGARRGPMPFGIDRYALVGRGAVLLSRDKPTAEQIEAALAR